MSTTLDPNATIVISGLPTINNSGISFILRTEWQNTQKLHLPDSEIEGEKATLKEIRQVKTNYTLSVFVLTHP